MGFKEQIKKFYLEHAPGATVEENLLKAPCPFCSSGETEKPAMMVVCLNPESYFFGYFRCLNRCLPGGFPPYFARIMGLEPQKYQVMIRIKSLIYKTSFTLQKISMLRLRNSHP